MQLVNDSKKSLKNAATYITLLMSTIQDNGIETINCWIIYKWKFKHFTIFRTQG